VNKCISRPLYISHRRFWFDTHILYIYIYICITLPFTSFSMQWATIIFLIHAHIHIQSVYITTDHVPSTKIIQANYDSITSFWRIKHTFWRETLTWRKIVRKDRQISESPMTGPHNAETRPQFSRSAKNNKNCFLTTSVGASGPRAGAGGVTGCSR